MNLKTRHCERSEAIQPRVILWIAASLTLLAMIGTTLASPQEELEQNQKDMQAAREQQSALSEEQEKLKEELKDLQEKLVRTADAIQKTELETSETEEKLRVLDEQVEAKKESLKEEQQHLSQLVMAELSISSTPPEAMLMMPDDPLQVMKVARALNMASGSIRREAQALGQQLEELNMLQKQVTQHKSELAALSATLDSQRKDINAQLADRTALQKKLGKQQKQVQETLERLARKSSDLKDLIKGLEKEETKVNNGAITSALPPREGGIKKLRSFADAKGHIRPPASGQLVRKFGASQGHNSTSKGITIATRSGARVTAPFDGEVVFTGPFLNYGKMIIIRHSDDFHTLLAGLAKIDVEVGQFLLEGEPIGAMGDDEHTLYIELRKENQPVDPALWISGLNKKK